MHMDNYMYANNLKREAHSTIVKITYYESNQRNLTRIHIFLSHTLCV